MSEFIQSRIVAELADITYTMWRLGWDEKNGGNVSCLLTATEVDLLAQTSVPRAYHLAHIPSELVGRYVLITASGSNFRVLKDDLVRCTGVLRFTASGYEIVWGFEDQQLPTSEIYMHVLAHGARLSVDPQHRVVVHNHATEISGMTFAHELDEDKLTRTLWGIITECIIVFPDGVALLPWMVPGNETIGLATAAKLQSARIVVWAHHGILATGSSFQDAFGLIETVNKAAKIYLQTYQQRLTAGITDQGLLDLCAAFEVTPKAGILKPE